MRSLLALLLVAGCTPSPVDPPDARVADARGAGARPDSLSADSLSGVFEGYYSAGFEHTGFVPCADTTEFWWTEPASTLVPLAGYRDQYRVEMAPGAAAFDSAYVALTGYDGVAVTGPVVWARLRGRATPLARRTHGHDGQYDRAFAVDSVEAMSADALADAACARPAGVRP